MAISVDPNYEAINNLQDSLVKAIEDDLVYSKTPSLIPHRGLLKKHLSLMCEPRPFLGGAAPEIRLTANPGRFFPMETYDEKFAREFLAGFVGRNDSFEKTVQLMSKYFPGGGDGARLVSELYLVVFCYAAMKWYLEKGSLTSSDRENFTQQFLRGLREANGGLVTKLKAGVDGIYVGEDTLLKPNENEGLLIRPPKLEDYSEPVISVEQWDGDYDYEKSPHFPYVSSYVEIELKTIAFHSLAVLGMDTRWHDPIRPVDWLANGVEYRAYRFQTILSLFQSKASPHFQSLVLSLALKFVPGARYDVKLSVKPTRIENRPHYLLTKDNAIKLNMFWDRMNRVNWAERVYGKERVEGKEPPGEHVAKPLEIAYHRYLKILDSWDETVVRIHDTVEALEGFFTPDEESRKIFIPRFSMLLDLFPDLDPNDTDWILQEGFHIRSDYSHRASGWEGDLPEVIEDDDIDASRRASENEFQRAISPVLLTYLRISIVSRILSALSDIEFIELLDNINGHEKLKNLLAGLDHLVHADPLTYVDRTLVKCSLCKQEIHWTDFPEHIENTHSEMVREQYGDSKYHPIFENGFEILEKAATKSINERGEITTSELFGALQGIDPSFGPWRFFVEDLDNFVILCHGILRRKKIRVEGGAIYTLVSPKKTSL